MKLLIAEDDRDLRCALQVFFQRNNFTADTVGNGEDALAYLELGTYDAAVLDVMMPKMDGVTVVKRLRKAGVDLPILLLTAKGEIEDRVEGLEAGANDYLPKPFDLRELLARVQVLLRPRTQSSSCLSLGNFSLDTSCFLLEGPSGKCFLPNKEYQTLLLLMRHPGRPFSAQALLDRIWAADSIGGENALWTVIYNLRKKLLAAGADGVIRNKRNQGYLLEVEQ